MRIRHDAGVGHLVGGAELDFEAWIERIRPEVERAMAERAARVREAMREASKTKAQGPYPAPTARRPRVKRKGTAIDPEQIQDKALALEREALAARSLAPERPRSRRARHPSSTP